MYYVKKKGNTLEIWENPNDFGASDPRLEHNHIATIHLHNAVEFYENKFCDTIERRWNYLRANKMRETEEANRHTGEVEHYIVKNN